MAQDKEESPQGVTPLKIIAAYVYDDPAAKNHIEHYGDLSRRALEKLIKPNSK